ncbi:MAG TPA: NUDIX domain-containing protein, partial [Amaricoccus sp.]|nr:NUDIX domain-containing protein [Amaricoccus sp.]
MSEIFLHPPFDDPAVLAIVLGPEPPFAARPGALAGFALRADRGAVRVALAPEPGGRVEGAWADPPAAARARLDFALRAMGAAPVGGREGEAYVFADAPGHGWPGGPRPEERRARFAEALAEIMGHYDRRPAEEVAGLLHGIGIRALARARGAESRTPIALRSGLTAADVAGEAREFSYARYFGMEEHRLRHRRFDGGTSETIDRAVFTSGDAITVLPFDPRTGMVLLIEQFRCGPWARRDPHPWSLETVAGRCDVTEPPEATARREAREEAGLELGRIEEVAAFYPSPGIVAEHITAFVAEADLAAAGGVHGLAEEHEDIRALVVPLEDALAAIETGEINTSPLMV